MIIQKNNSNEVNTPVDNNVRVALYACTASKNTPIDYQLSSLNEAVTQNPDWTLVATYADEGISTESTKSRIAFNQMIEDARNGNFDLIVTYSISRFSRNASKILEYAKELSDYNVNIHFVSEDISTNDSDGLFRLCIIASVLENERRLHFERVKAGIRAAKSRKEMSSDGKNN